MADQNLTAEIDIKTNSPLARKQLLALEKELMKVNKALMKADKAGGEFKRSVDSIQLKKLNQNVEDLNKSLKGLDSAMPSEGVKNLDREMKNLNSTISTAARLAPTIRALSVAFDLLTNVRLLKRLSKLARIAGLIARLKGYKALSKVLRSLAKGFAFAAKEAAKFNAVLEKFNLAKFNKDVQGTTSVIDQLGQAIRTLESALTILRNIGSALEFMADPARLKRLATLLRLLGNIAILKGFESQGKAIKGASLQLEGFSDTIEEFQNSSKGLSDKLVEMDSKVGILVNTLSVLETGVKAAGLSIAGLSVLKIGETFAKDVIRLSRVFDQDLVRAITETHTRVELFRNSFKFAMQTTGNSIKKALLPQVPGILGTSDELAKLGVVLAALGSKMQNSENQFISFAGTLTKIVGVAIGGISIAVTLLIAAMGALIQNLSIKLFNVLDELSIKFEQGRAKIQQFAFVVKGFGKVFGEEVAGNLKQWNNLIGEVTAKSVTAAGEVRKSISALVKEAQILGLTASDIEKIVTRANDVAAATGKNLSDVVQSLISGFVGQSQAALNLGVDLREVTVAHSQLGKGVDDLTGISSNNAKVQLRVNEFYKQTIPLLGAAALSIDTLTGSSQKLAEQQQTLGTRIGGSADILILYNQVLTGILKVINLLPDEFFQVIGTLAQVGSIVGIVIGTFLKYAAVITTLITVFTILNSIIVSSITIQGALTASFGRVAASAGVATGSVTGLSSALAAATVIIKAQLATLVTSLGSSLIAILASLKVAFIVVAKAAAAFLVAIAPLVIKISILVGIAVALVNAVKDLANQMGGLGGAFLAAVTPMTALSNRLVTGKESVEDLETAAENLTNTLRRVIITIASLVKVIVSGLAQGILLVNEGILNLRLLAADAGKESQTLRVALNENAQAMARLGKISEVAQAGLFTFGDEAAIAFEKVLQFGEAAVVAGNKTDKAGDQASSGAGKIKRSAEEIARSLESLKMANMQLRLDVDLVGASQIAALQKRAAFEQNIIGLQISKLDSEKESAEVQALLTQQLLVQQKAAAEIADIRSTTAENLLLKNEELNAAIDASNLKGIEQDQARLTMQLARIDKEIHKQTIEDAGNSKAIEALQTQRALVEQIGKKAIFEKSEKALATILDKEKELVAQLEMAGLEGEELAAAQLKAEFDKIDAAVARLKLEKKISKEQLAAAQQSAANQKKILASASKKKGGKGGEEEGSDILADLGDAAGAVAGVMDSIFSASEQASGQFALSMEQANASLFAGFENLPDFAMSMVDSSVAMIDGLVARAPEVIDSMVEALPTMIDKLADVFVRLIDALPMIVDKLADALPGIVAKIMDRLPEIIQKLSMAIPAILASLMENIPTLISNILDRLPAILSALIEGLVGAMGEIVAAFIDTFVTKGGAIKIAVSIVKGIIQSIGAIVTGLSKGLQRAIKGIFKGFEIPPFAGEKLIKNLQKGMKKVVTGLTGATEQAFGVIDIPTGGKDGKKKLEDVGAQVQKVLANTGKSVKGLWDSFLSALKAVWMEIWKRVLEPIINAIRQVWLFVWENVLEPIVNLLTSWHKALWATFQNVINLLGKWHKAVLKVFKNVLKLIAGWYKAVWDTFRNVVKLLASWYKAVWDTFRNVVGIFTDWLTALWQTFMNVVGIFKEAFNVILNFFQEIFKGNIKEAFQGVFDFFGKLPEMVFKAFRPIFDFWSTLGSKVMEAFEPIFSFFGNLGGELLKAFKPITDFIGNLGGAISSAFKPITNFFGGIKGLLKDAFKPLTDFFNPEAIGNILKKAFAISPIGLLFKSDAIKGFIQKAINLLNPGSLLSKIFNIDSGLPSEGTIEKIIGLDLPYANFAQGGIVPGTAPAKGDSLINDKILAMLSPGEFVVPRSIAMMPGMAEFLTQMVKSGTIPQLGIGGFVEAVVTGDSEGAQEEASGAIGSDPLGGVVTSGEKAIKDTAAATEKAFKDTMNALEGLGIPDPIKFLKKHFGEAIDKTIGANKFEQGGPTGAGGPALLHPGEFVLRQSAVQGIGQSQAEFINRRGRLPTGDMQKTQNVTIVFEPGSIAMQGVQDPDRFVDELLDTMKRRGIDGDFVMSSSGLRETS